MNFYTNTHQSFILVCIKEFDLILNTTTLYIYQKFPKKVLQNAILHEDQGKQKI